MKRGELLGAIDSIDTKIDQAIVSNEESMWLLDRAFPLDQCDLVLGSGYVRGEFSSIAEVCIKQVLDERRCGGLRHNSLNLLIPLAIEIEYKERGHELLPNGFSVDPKNIKNMLMSEED